MSKVIPINNRQQISDEAGLWLARLERGLSPGERNEIEGWLAESDAHAEALSELAYVWDDMGVLEELSDLFPLPSPAEEKKAAYFWLIPRKAVYACASIVVVLASAYGLINGAGGLPGSSAELRTVAQQTATPAVTAKSSHPVLADNYETAIGEQSKVNLPDGSIVTLNTGTRIKVNYTDSERQIVLENGEGYFEVAKDWARPFVVHVGKNEVRAVGTAFNVDYSNSDNLEVTVTEGKIKLVSPKKLRKILLTGSLAEESFVNSGQSLSIAHSDEHKLKAISKEDIATKLAWQQGMVIFEREPLKDALAELSRYTLVEFLLADSAMEDILVGGYFKSGDIDGLLLALEENFNIASTKDAAGRIILTAQ